MGLRPGWDKRPGRKLKEGSEGFFPDTSLSPFNLRVKMFYMNPSGESVRRRYPIVPPAREEFSFSDEFIALMVGLKPFEVEEMEDAEMRKPFEPLLLGKGRDGDV